jgi:exopolysaccharide biosynthesis protein
MKVHYLLKLSTFLLFYIPSLVFSQDQDSLQIVQAQWNKKEIKKGVIWNQGHFSNLFNSVQEINWVEIDLRKHHKHIHIAGDSTILKTTSKFAEENMALVAINASFFDMKNGGSVDYLKVDGKIINTGKQENSNVRANAVFSISDKKIRVEHTNKITVQESDAGSVMVAGPLLIDENEYVLLPKNAFNDNRHPRTAIAITGNNKLIFMVVDGRSNQANGMNLHELSKVFKWLGAKNAMNLDGGGSSTLYIRNATDNGVVNYPSDNKKFDHEGQRSVANIIYLK